MRTKKGLLKTKRKLKKIHIILLIIIFIIIFLIILNLFTRKQIQLSDSETNYAEKIFSKEHIKTIRIYQGGLVSLGSTKTLCNSIYFKNDFEISLLIHELTHTYQAKTTLKCIKMSLLSLYSQFSSFLKYGSRNYAYYYNINTNSLDKTESNFNYNPEQEASIIEDYFNLKFLDEKISNTYCSNCQNYSKQELIEKLDRVVTKILDKYKN